jgi:undecaprenyl diphosphate synthase
MNLLINAVNDNLETLIQKNIKVLIIGDMQTLPDDVRTAVEKTIASTAKNTGLTLIIALNYSSRWEITSAVQEIAKKIQNKQLKPDDISEKIISQHLNTKDIPDPDLLIRTSGEYRISNFLLWQLSYSELYFTNTLWPDFRRQQFLNAIDDYRNRERRFGKTSEQLK